MTKTKTRLTKCRLIDRYRKQTWSQQMNSGCVWMKPNKRCLKRPVDHESVTAASVNVGNRRRLLFELSVFLKLRNIWLDASSHLKLTQSNRNSSSCKFETLYDFIQFDVHPAAVHSEFRSRLLPSVFLCLCLFILTLISSEFKWPLKFSFSVKFLLVSAVFVVFCWSLSIKCSDVL